MKTQELPAGLVDENVEVFVYNDELKATYNGSVRDFMSLPKHIINQFYRLLVEDSDARQEFIRHNIMDMDFMMKEYVRCNFGGWDRTPDLAGGEFHREHWSCPRRGECPYNERICPGVKAKNGYLSRREVDVIKLIAKGYYAKEIADEYGISEHTARTHTRNIHGKLGVNNNAEVTNFAFRNNLIQ